MQAKTVHIQIISGHCVSEYALQTVQAVQHGLGILLGVLEPSETASGHKHCQTDWRSNGPTPQICDGHLCNLPFSLHGCITHKRPLLRCPSLDDWLLCACLTCLQMMC